MSKLQEIIIAPGTRAAQPSAASVPTGALYCVTDEGNKVERNNGVTWAAYAPVGTGDVVGPAASVASEAVLFDGTTGKLVKRATGTGVVHRTSGVDSVSNVVLTSEVTGVLPIANMATGTPDGTKFVRDDGALATPAGGGGAVVQVKNVQTGVYATGTTIIPNDDTIPQITEGDEYMTLAITPTSATNKLRIDVVAFVRSSIGNWVVAALFQDAIANALAAFSAYNGTAGGSESSVFSHYMTAGTTSAMTFRVRCGGGFAATTSFNGTTTRLFGGVMASSITITEITP